MNDYDFGKYYRSRNKITEKKKSPSLKLNNLYKKLSIVVAAAIILFFAGLMTGINLNGDRITNKEIAITDTYNQPDIVESSDISPESSSNFNQNNFIENQPEKKTSGSEIRSSLVDPENAYIILAKRYHEDSKDRALYYAGVLKKLAKESNYDVIPSVRGKSIKIYVGPMKGKKNAEKMLARVKSIPEFTNSAILYKK
jgi:hypothetical protein